MGRREKQVRCRYGLSRAGLSSLEWEDFETRATGIEEEYLERTRTAMVASAFTAWQMGHGEKGKSFEEHLRKMGLAEAEPVMTETERKATVQKAIAEAEIIRAAMSAGRYENGSDSL